MDDFFTGRIEEWVARKSRELLQRGRALPGPPPAAKRRAVAAAAGSAGPTADDAALGFDVSKVLRHMNNFERERAKKKRSG